MWLHGGEGCKGVQDCVGGEVGSDPCPGFPYSIPNSFQNHMVTLFISIPLLDINPYTLLTQRNSSSNCFVEH